MSFKFEKLGIWQDSLKLTVAISHLSQDFPQSEIFCLSKQIRRAADSVVLNIAEGSTGQSNPEQSKFLKYALRSAIEVVSCLFIAKSKNYLKEEIFLNFYQDYEILCKKINRFISAIKQPK